MDYCYNYVPGRIRIQTPYIHNNPQNTETFGETFQSLEGITSIETNPVIGSALIHFDENKIKHEQIIGFLEKHTRQSAAGRFIQGSRDQQVLPWYY